MSGYEGSDKLINGMLNTHGINDLLNIPGVSDVAINRPGELWYLPGMGEWQRKAQPSLTYANCMSMAKAMATFHGRDINPQSPVKTVELPGEERGLIVIPPACSKNAVSFTLRKPSLTRLTLDDYIDSGRFETVNVRDRMQNELQGWQKELAMELKKKNWRYVFNAAIEHRLNIIIFGGTGSGKTTFAKSIVDLYPRNRRMLTIEEVNELKLPYHPNHVHLIYGDYVTSKELVTAAMRMKPDHVFLAEITGDEVWDYITLLNTGHPGSITTCHADGTLEGFSRTADLVKQSGIGGGLTFDYILNKVKTAFDLVIYMKDTYIHEASYIPEEKLEILARGLM
ncbi:TPA: P-type DNA transfer ATPase VirB11 [Escherichia coli]|nr:P-type DNA transfer ATPase VirB11 [Escherichia coli]